MSFGTFNGFVATAFKQRVSPFDYQRRLAEDPECKSRPINVPAGCGKTAAVVSASRTDSSRGELAWLWNRVFLPSLNSQLQTLNSSEWPRRLVYCLPMRTLVEQTRDEVKKWLKNLGNLERDSENDHSGKIGVHILMGGEEKTDWDIYPEHEAILIGTQDMLISRALNRSYGMSRCRWPMHFGLLKNGCLWLMDKIQLMGSGPPTTAQLQTFRAADERASTQKRAHP